MSSTLRPSKLKHPPRNASSLSFLSPHHTHHRHPLHRRLFSTHHHHLPKLQPRLLLRPITNITYPFSGGDRPAHCGFPGFSLTCRDNTITELTTETSLTYRVLQIHQPQKTLILSRSDLYNNTCPSEFHNTTLNSTLFSYDGPQNDALNLVYGCNTSAMTARPYNLFSCNSADFNFTDSYYLVGPVPRDPILRLIYCGMIISVPVLRSASNGLTDLQLSLGEALMQGFSVNYSDPYERFCSKCSGLGGQCGFDSVLDRPLCICGDRPCPFASTLLPEGMSPNARGPFVGSRKVLSDQEKYVIIGVSLGIAGIVISSIIIFYIRKQFKLQEADQESKQNIDKFLLSHGSLAPKRYNYREIKKITNSFAEKLGKGGYGIVYKGKLPAGQLVAVKVLTETDNNAEEFINEVASISRTSHVNIVNLLGFCYDRKKRVLVYEYMPNKSLDKFICKSGGCQLDWETLYGIAVGVARGLEYLHRGCNTRIVHFDIKPQNILLDEDFCPKISDFGLAKLFKKKQSIISMLGTRGTVGYIAPEVFSRNFGAVSHKSDVYSFGMMLLEMAGARKNDKIEGIESSEDYFLDKIYGHVVLKNEKLDGLMTEEQEESARKMLLVGVWCIQTAPSDRPPMTKVLEMLEGSLESIQIPPKPFLYSPNLSGSLSSSVSVDVDTEIPMERIATG
ncbi:UNVERIFIED_CONTAM: LEAF RUST 10 DISEASE-RESISTANCE LOCUS RECEPTOR-LIKE PROTEIN KINASE-like 2.4 [Sesamum radiatum]|uniref:non-specific serine/threonine protein kinase n=1 Tax=Sesamum radiatum TaxID=300843 RepID=A0AAW2RCT1_SESRA